MKRLREGLDLALGSTLASLMAVAVLAVVWQVVSRYWLGSPSSFTEELVRFLLIWIGILGGAYAAGQHQHMAVDFLPGGWSPRRRASFGLAVQVLVGIFAVVVLGYGGTRLSLLQFELGQRSAALGWPLGAVYAALPLGGLALALYSILHGHAAWREIRGA